MVDDLLESENQAKKAELADLRGTLDELRNAERSTIDTMQTGEIPKMRTYLQSFLDLTLQREFNGTKAFQELMHLISSASPDNILSAIATFVDSPNHVNRHSNLIQTYTYHRDAVRRFYEHLPQDRDDPSYLYEMITLVATYEKTDYSKTVEGRETLLALRTAMMDAAAVRTRGLLSANYTQALKTLHSNANMAIRTSEHDESQSKKYDDLEKKKSKGKTGSRGGRESKPKPKPKANSAATELPSEKKGEISEMIKHVTRNDSRFHNSAIKQGKAAIDKKGRSVARREAADVLKDHTIMRKIRLHNGKMKLQDALSIDKATIKKLSPKEYEALLLLNPSFFHDPDRGKHGGQHGSGSANNTKVDSGGAAEDDGRSPDDSTLGAGSAGQESMNLLTQKLNDLAGEIRWLKEEANIGERK